MTTYFVKSLQLCEVFFTCEALNIFFHKIDILPPFLVSIFRCYQKDTATWCRLFKATRYYRHYKYYRQKPLKYSRLLYGYIFTRLRLALAHTRLKIYLHKCKYRRGLEKSAFKIFVLMGDRTTTTDARIWAPICTYLQKF